MRLLHQDVPLSRAAPSVILWARLLARLYHFLVAALPAALTLDFHAGDQQPMVLGVMAGVVCVLAFGVTGVYGRQMFTNQLQLRRMLLAWSATFGLVLLLHSVFVPASQGSLGMAMAWYTLTALLLVVGRMVILAVFARLMGRGYFVGRSVILGATRNGRLLAERMLRNGEIGSGLLGFIDDRAPERLDVDLHAQLLGDFHELERLIRDNQVDQVLVALPMTASRRNQHYAAELRRLPVEVFLVPEMDSFDYAMPRVAEIADIPMLVVCEPPLKGWAPTFKRLEDIVLASIALLLLSPLMLLVAVAVKCDSRGPVLFRQKRYGYNQQLIEVYKFRSMFHQQRDMDAARQTTSDDPRVTRVGRFIRRTSLDELPQLLNVLEGSMSLVGPRPHATATKAADLPFEQAVANYVARHKVKPGITGLAQVYGYRGETDTVEKIQKRVEYDLAYIENWSLGLDVYVLLRTVPAVLSMKAAY